MKNNKNGEASACVFCGNSMELIKIKDKPVCKTCIDKILHKSSELKASS